MKVIKKHPQVRYTIVGDGPERTYLELLTHQLYIQDYVTFVGESS